MARLGSNDWGYKWNYVGYLLWMAFLPHVSLPQEPRSVLVWSVVGTP